MKISNIISTSTKNTRFHKITEVLLKKWACHTHFEISKHKIEKGMAGSILDPNPCNFRKWCIFIRCLNVNSIFFNNFDLQLSTSRVCVFCYLKKNSSLHKPLRDLPVPVRNFFFKKKVDFCIWMQKTVRNCIFSGF